MKKIIAISLVIVLTLTTFTACGGGAKTSEGKPLVTINIAEEPKTIDPALNSSLDGGTYLVHVFEGLTTVDKDLNFVPGVAEKWDISDDGMVYTFHLRDNAKWSDGEPVTAKDFEYAWKRVVDPKTACEYAYQMYYVKNAEKVNLGEAPVEDLGVKVIDDKTFEVTLEAPCQYFTQLTAFPTLFPVREDILTKNPTDWTNDPKTYIGNGPFQMTEWAHDAHINMSKNPNYWNADNISDIDLQFVLMADDNTVYAAFQNGDLMYADTLPVSEIPATKKAGTLSIEPQIATYSYVFNTERAPFDNPKVRKALALAVDRQFLIDNIWKDERFLAGAFVSPGIKDSDGKDFRGKVGEFFDPTKEAYEANLAEAKSLLAEAGYPDGKGFPTIEFITNDTQGHIDVAEAIQQQWEKGLGIKMNIAKQEWGVFQQTRKDGNFDIARHGWVADYADPMTFLDMWASNSAQNDANYNNPEYDRLIGAIRVEKDVAKRMQMLHDAERLLVGEDMAILPLSYYSDIFLTAPELKNAIYSPLGFKYFMWCTVEEKK